MALAFGLGGREVAGQMLGEAYDRGREQKDTVKRDAQIGKERGKRDAERARGEAEHRTNDGDGTTAARSMN